MPQCGRSWRAYSTAFPIFALRVAVSEKSDSHIPYCIFASWRKGEPTPTRKAALTICSQTLVHLQVLHPLVCPGEPVGHYVPTFSGLTPFFDLQQVLLPIIQSLGECNLIFDVFCLGPDLGHMGLDFRLKRLSQRSQQVLSPCPEDVSARGNNRSGLC